MANLELKYFSTPTCNVCKVLKPKVEELLKEIGDWTFQFIDTTQSMQEAAQQLVFAVPTILLYVNGKEVQRFSRNVGLSELEFALIRIKELSQD